MVGLYPTNYLMGRSPILRRIGAGCAPIHFSLSPFQVPRPMGN